MRGRQLSKKEQSEFVKRSKEALGELAGVLPDKTLRSYLAFVATHARVAPMSMLRPTEENSSVLWKRNAPHLKELGVNHTEGYEVPGRGLVPTRFYIGLDDEIWRDFLQGGEKGREVFWHETAHGILNAAGFPEKEARYLRDRPELVENRLSELYSVTMAPTAARAMARRMARNRFDEAVKYLTHLREEALPDIISAQALAKAHGNRGLTRREILEVTEGRPWPVKRGIYSMLGKMAAAKRNKMGLLERAAMGIEKVGKITDIAGRVKENISPMKAVMEGGPFSRRRRMEEPALRRRAA